MVAQNRGSVVVWWVPTLKEAVISAMRIFRAGGRAQRVAMALSGNLLTSHYINRQAVRNSVAPLISTDRHQIILSFRVDVVGAIYIV